MSFIRTKISHGREYAYEVETYRDRDGTVRQRVLRYIGPTNPRYGGKVVDVHDEKEQLRNRGRRSKS